MNRLARLAAFASVARVAAFKCVARLAAFATVITPAALASAIAHAALASVIALAACSGASTPSPAPTSTARVAAPANALDMTGSLAITSEEVTFTAGGSTVPGTLVRPTAAPTTPDGKRPAVVLMAGSGPTDRDWNSPLLPGKNGSAKLLAEALARRGVIVLRFDKASVGANKTSLANATFDIYRDEGRAALALLRARPDAGNLYIAGHSEGGMHALRVALAEGPQLAGLLLLSTSARSMFALILSQLEHQLRAAFPHRAGAPDRADAELAGVRAAFDAFLAGKPVDATQHTQIPQLQLLINSITTPATATLARSMFAFDPLPELARVTVPILVYNGRRDIQVDPELDAKPLAAANPRAELMIAADADHVLKLETRTIAELRADLMMVQTQMNAETRVLDPATVELIAGWLAKH